MAAMTHTHLCLLVCLFTMNVFISNADAGYPGEKLADLSQYGFDEYLMWALASFITFVAGKHLVFHTGYFWWFNKGRFVFPKLFNSLITGNSLQERIFAHVNSNLSEGERNGMTEVGVAHVLELIDDYCHKHEFATNLGREKGKLLSEIVKESQPTRVLMLGCSYGCGMLHVMNMTSANDDVAIHVVDDDLHNVALLNRLARLVKRKVTCEVVNDETLMTSSAVTSHGSDAGKYDLVVTTRKHHEQPSWLKTVELIEENELLNPGARIFADKVVFFTDPAYLMHVRESPKYQSTYHQMALEHSSYDILDGIEISQFTGGESGH